MYIQRISAIHVPLLFKGTQMVKKALLDSGATENFLDTKTVHRLKLATHTLKEPRYMYAVDGLNNKAGQITHSCQLELTYNDKKIQQQFFISDLGQDRALLGYPFLQEFNPHVDWEKGKLHEAKGVIIQQNTCIPKRNVACEIIRIQHEAIKQVGPIKPGETIYMWQTTFATQWAVTAEKGNKRNHKFLKNMNNIKSYFQKKQPNCKAPENLRLDLSNSGK